MCSLSTTNVEGVEKKQYVFEVIMGLGFGLVLTSLLTLIPLVANKKDTPIIIGAITQVRVLGGTIGLGTSTTVLNSFVKRNMTQELSMQQIGEISQSLSAIAKLTEREQMFVKRTFAQGYARQMRVIAGFSGLVVLSSLLMVERVPRRHVLREQAVVDGEERGEGP